MFQMLDKQNTFYKSHNIDFNIFNKEYNLRRIPFVRPYINDRDSLDYYIMEVYKLWDNIQDAKTCAETDLEKRWCDEAERYFLTVTGKNWRDKMQDLISFINDYNTRLVKVYEREREKEREV